MSSFFKFALGLLMMCSWLNCSQDDSAGLTVKQTIDQFNGDIIEPEGNRFAADLRGVPVVVSGQELSFFVTASRHSSGACGTCHVRDFKPPPGQSAHWGLGLKHGPVESMNCQTCHQQENKMLHTLTGSELPFDQAYNQCGQCHFEQKRDWIGGAHGKRVTAWAGTRLIENCTSCHDPHRPKLTQRWPAMAPGPVNTQPSQH